MRTKSILLFATMLLFLCEAKSDGKEIKVLLRSGEAVKGELIAVRSNAILIAKESGLDDTELAEDATSITLVPKDRIARVSIEGKSYVLVGALIGLPTGILAGAAIGAATSNRQPGSADEAVGAVFAPVGGALIGCLVGPLLGMIVGGAASERDMDIEPGEVEQLGKFARYKEGEPEYLQRVQ